VPVSNGQMAASIAKVNNATTKAARRRSPTTSGLFDSDFIKLTPPTDTYDTAVVDAGRLFAGTGLSTSGNNAADMRCPRPRRRARPSASRGHVWTFAAAPRPMPPMHAGIHCAGVVVAV
jgi:hypothetical protein